MSDWDDLMRSYRPLVPLYKYAGGKGRLLQVYRTCWPDMTQFDNYVEPFFGGGAVWCWMRNEFPHLHTTVGDIKVDLIAMLREIQESPEAVADRAESLIQDYLPLSHKERKNWYYRMRDEYWEFNDRGEKAGALLYLLLRMGFNGWWKTVIAGGDQFGTAAGLLDHRTLGQVVKRDAILRWGEELQDLHAGDYRTCPIPTTGRTLIYLDPPYRDSFTYSVDFGDDAQEELLEWALARCAEGATVVLANRVVGEDKFFESRLSQAEFHYFTIRYTAPVQAVPAQELLAIIPPGDY